MRLCRLVSCVDSVGMFGPCRLDWRAQWQFPHCIDSNQIAACRRSHDKEKGTRPVLFCVKIGGKEVSVKAADAAEVAGGLDFMNHVDAVFCHMLVVSF